MTTPNVPLHDLVRAIVPMLADTDDIPITSLIDTHLFDTKLDGVRALAAWDGFQLTLRNRNNRLMDNYPDLEAAAQYIHGPAILDGEIISESGKFQDAAWRDKQRGSKTFAAMREHPAQFVAFDILWDPDLGDVRHLTFVQRRQLLDHLQLERFGGGRWRATEISSDPKFYKVIRQMGGEGVVAKRKNARYQAGRRKDWLKFKSKHRVTCIGTGYEPGKGARAEFGALYLAVIDTDASKSVDVGRVGSGFTLPQTLEMKQILDNAQALADLPLVEIECLGITRDGKLRQPVFIGFRTDLLITDAIAAQLKTLPVT
jgi:bifunctional non-homologous end joining protein LigD